MTARFIHSDGTVEETSKRDFFTRIFGHPPRSNAEWESEKRRSIAKLEAEHQRELMELRRRILAQFKTDESRARMLAAWEAEGVDVTQLTETRGDPLLVKRRAA
jgi:hypothetical protein